jgi:branched-chain amino acid transport system ATP-binding protein
VTPILETRGLTKRFGGVTAIDDVDFRVMPGELRCLIGPNGAGKSTFFKMLTAQYAPSAGSIVFDGVDITRAEPHEISRMGVGIKNQAPDVLNGVSVSENIWLAARAVSSAKEAQHQTAELVARFDLGALRNKQVGILSHGQRQWVEFAMVSATRPRLALLDEPTAGMTDDETRRTAALIRDMNRSMAIIVVEHDMQFIRDIAETVTVFHQGRIIAEDSIDAILQNEQVRDVYLGSAQHA